MSNKKLYSYDGLSCHITKLTKNGKWIEYGWVDMDRVVASLRQHGDICVVIEGCGIKRTEVLRVVNEWRDKIKFEREKTAFLRSFNVHPNCFYGNDE